MSKWSEFDLPLFSQEVIKLTHATLFFLVPLIFLPNNSELFEFNKMLLTYTAAAVILVFELIRLLSAKTPAINVPPLWQTGLFFLLALFLSTLTSVDQHVSIFGYYGRFHGGLLSWLAYSVIYFSLIQLPPKFYLNLIKLSLFSALVVSIWAILEHFGHSPSCVLLTGQFDADCWVQDVKARVFATLGQPNWLAAFLVMLIPWALSLYLLTNNRSKSFTWLALLVLAYGAFTFTYSRGGGFGLISALGIFLFLLGTRGLKELWKKLLPVGLAMVAITLIFASPFTESLVGTTPSRDVGTLAQGTETGNIRLIVWQGAWEIFKSNPILGTGVETFGEGYYQFRPVEMNETAEWDFLFNKAHNEYLNYLSTTGLVGTAAYLLLLANFFWLIYKQILKNRSSTEAVFLTGAAASIVGYLVQNLFGFTVVPLAILFILNLAAANIPQKVTTWHWPSWWNFWQKRSVQLLLLIPLFLMVLTIFNFWRADVYYSEGASANGLGDSSYAEQKFKQALELNPFEPNYMIQLAFAQSLLAENYQLSEGGRALVTSSEAYANQATNISPRNLNMWRIKGQIFEGLAKIDSSFIEKAKEARVRAAQLAPTEPQVRADLASFYRNFDQKDLALKTYLESLALKPNLLISLIAVIEIYLEEERFDRAKLYLAQAQEIAPDNPQIIILSQKVAK